MKGPSLPGLDAGRAVLDVLEARGSLWLTAGGHSMAPAIRDGDRLRVEPLRSPPRRGDVLACEIDGRLVIHRLVGPPGELMEVRGDVAPEADPPVAPGAVRGRVTAVERHDRRVRLGLVVGQRALAWLSRRGLLRAAAEGRAALSSDRSGHGIRLALPVRVRAGGASS